MVEARAISYEHALSLTPDGGLQLRELLASGSVARGRLR